MVDFSPETILFITILKNKFGQLKKMLIRLDPLEFVSFFYFYYEESQMNGFKAKIDHQFSPLPSSKESGSIMMFFFLMKKLTQVDFVNGNY